MVYESDFYTTRRPYRATPSLSSYTVSTIIPSRQIRILPGIGKVHIVHSYDRLIPYIGHKRLTVVSPPPYYFRVRPSVFIREIDRITHKARPYFYYSPTSSYLNSEAATVHVVHSYDRQIPYIGHKRLTVVSPPPHYFRVRPSVVIREIDRITHKARPYIYYSPTSSYLNSEAATIQQKIEHVTKDIDDTIDQSYNRRQWFFDDETRLIRAQSHALLKRIHAPLPRVRLSWPITAVRYHYESPLPLRITSDDYIHRMLTPIKSMKYDIYNISHNYYEPIRRPLGVSHLACIRYGGEKAYSRRRNLTLQDIYSMQSDTVRNDIQLLSYYIKANKERKALESAAPPAKALPAARPSRIFSKPQLMSGDSEEIIELREQRAERLKKIQELEDKPASVEDAGARIKRSTKKQEEERLAEERALAEETAKKKEQARREEEARRAELARQEALAAQAAAERQAELDRKAELARQEELARQVEEERKAEQARIAAEKAEQARLEEEKKQAELAKQEEERQQLLRLEEIARQAEEEKERELARQAAELAELARQEAELADQARLEAEERARQEEEEAGEKAKQEAELAEMANREAELAELEKQEKELAELDRQERDAAEEAKQEVEKADEEKETAEIAAAESNIPADEETKEAAEEETPTEPEATEDVADPVVEEPKTPEISTQEDKPTAEEVVDEEEEEEEEEE